MENPPIPDEPPDDRCISIEMCDINLFTLMVKGLISPGFGIIDDDAIFTYKRKHSSNIVRVYRLLPYLLAIIFIILAIDLISPDLIPLEIIPEMSIITLVILGLIFIFVLFRGSKQERYIYISMFILLSTIGLGAFLPDMQIYVFPLGITLVGVSLLYRVLTKINRDIGLNLGLCTILFSLSLAISIPTNSSVILAGGMILSSIFLLIARH